MAQMKPSIFNTEMVRAILDGRKTHTRRILKDQILAELVATGTDQCAYKEFLERSSPYKVGDIIYVRETWSDYPQYYIWYKADFPLHWDAKDTEHGDEVHIEAEGIKWKPSTHMLKEYARLFLIVKDVRIERLNEISEEDAIKEGILSFQRGVKGYAGNYVLTEYYSSDQEKSDPTAYDAFASLWESIYGNGSFDNRYVWVIEFERISKEEAMSETAT